MPPTEGVPLRGPFMSAEALFSVSGHVSISTESRPQTKGSQSPQEERCPCTAQVGTGRSEAAGRGACGRAGTQQGAHRPTPAPTPTPSPTSRWPTSSAGAPGPPDVGPQGTVPSRVWLRSAAVADARRGRGICSVNLGPSVEVASSSTPRAWV